MRWSIVRAASSISRNGREAVGNLGLSRTPTSGTPGTRSRNSPRRFGSISVVSKVTPIALPPGGLTLWTRPALTGSPPNRNTIGMVEVARLAASAAGSPPAVVNTLTPRLTRSAAIAGRRSYWPRAQRNSIATFWPYDTGDSIVEHVAGVDDFEVAE